jgi:hypothetical protein
MVIVRMKMSKVVTATIQFEFYPDEDDLMIENNYSDEEMTEYYRELTMEDISNWAIRDYQSLWNAIEVQIQNV